MRLIDADELPVRSIDETDLPRDKGLLVVLKEDIDNAPTFELFCHYQYDGEVKEPCVEGPCPHERPQGEWIPVSERLPEEKINPYTTDFDEVLCTTNWGEVLSLKFGTPILHNKPHFWLGGGIMDEHITAWQYKPEPYKKGGAE